jgi:hypothetical protein
MDLRFWSISASCFAGCVSLAGAATAAYSAELFPYNPPATRFGQQAQQRPAPQQSQLSSDELRTINRLASDVRKLQPAQQKAVREGVEKQLNDAVSRGDLRQIRYYNELLLHIRNIQ